MYNERDLAMEKYLWNGYTQETLPSPSLSNKMECIQHQSEQKIYPRITRTDQGFAGAKPPWSCNRSE